MLIWSCFEIRDSSQRVHLFYLVPHTLSTTSSRWRDTSLPGPQTRASSTFTKRPFTTAFSAISQQPVRSQARTRSASRICCHWAAGRGLSRLVQRINGLLAAGGLQVRCFPSCRTVSFGKAHQLILSLSIFLCRRLPRGERARRLRRPPTIHMRLAQQRL